MKDKCKPITPAEGINLKVLHTVELKDWCNLPVLVQVTMIVC